MYVLLIRNLFARPMNAVKWMGIEVEVLIMTRNCKKTQVERLDLPRQTRKVRNCALAPLPLLNLHA